MSTENANQQRVRLAAAKAGLQLWRNNNGACTDQTGRLIRYGLANDSKEINRHIKSSDLIGITPVTITPDMVGRVVGVFTAVECKAPDWKFSHADDRAVAQARFHEIVRAVGGFGGFARSPEEMFGILHW